MPTYEYECRECSYTFETFQSINDAPIKTCPLCGGEVRRLIGGGSGIIFKGPGFYVTDSKKTRSTPTGTKKASAPSDSSTSSAGTDSGTNSVVAPASASEKAG
jgi:putative FmdB family regulatory protein